MMKRFQSIQMKKAVFLLSLLALIAFRHLPYSFSEKESSTKKGIPNLQPQISKLTQLDQALENIMKQLVIVGTTAPTDQDYLIIMANDNIELIKLISFYNSESLSNISDKKINETYIYTYVYDVIQNLEFEKVRIKNNLEKIDSLSPLIKIKTASDAIEQARRCAQSILQIFDESIALLSRYRS